MKFHNQNNSRHLINYKVRALARPPRSHHILKNNYYNIYNLNIFIRFIYSLITLIL